jgi:hypothetical protein
MYKRTRETEVNTRRGGSEKIQINKNCLVWGMTCYAKVSLSSAVSFLVLQRLQYYIIVPTFAPAQFTW